MDVRISMRVRGVCVVRRMWVWDGRGEAGRGGQRRESRALLSQHRSSGPFLAQLKEEDPAGFPISAQPEERE